MYVIKEKLMSHLGGKGHTLEEKNRKDYLWGKKEELMKRRLKIK